jgi:hypothetical protein
MGWVLAKHWMRTVALLSLLSAGVFLACSTTDRDFGVGESGAAGEDSGNPGSGGSKAGSGNTNAGSGNTNASAGSTNQGGGAVTGKDCTATETEACYESPEGESYGAIPAKALGSCTIGVRTCGSAGAWGPCVGAVPAQDADTCEPGNDANCNSLPNEGCSCANGEQRDCGSDEGDCVKGKQTCAKATWGDCVGEVKPVAADTCEMGNDANCNGSANNGCECIDGATQDCGNATGNCKKGSQTCKNGAWGACTGGVAPAAADKCSPAGDDANCNGVPNEGCDCTAGATRGCAKCGTQTCGSDGKWGTTCANQKDCEPNDIQTDGVACGNCGTQSRKATCTAQCTWGAWANVGTCLGSGPCKPGVTANQMQTVACGNCGMQNQTRACSAQCDWPTTWTNDVSGCTGQGCVPGSKQAQASVPCGNYCGKIAQEKTCNNLCQYGPTTDAAGAVCTVSMDCGTNTSSPGDERTGYVWCLWPDPANGSEDCAPTDKCCLLNGGYGCTTGACTGGKIMACDGPEDCTGGKKCCTQFVGGGDENSYTTCDPSCASLARCHVDKDCDAGWHCSIKGGGSYHNGICYIDGGPE